MVSCNTRNMTKSTFLREMPCYPDNKLFPGETRAGLQVNGASRAFSPLPGFALLIFASAFPASFLDMVARLVRSKALLANDRYLRLRN